LGISTAEEEDTITVSQNRLHINHGRNLTRQENVGSMLRHCHLQNSRYVFKVSEVSVVIVSDESYQAAKILFSSCCQARWSKRRLYNLRF